MGRLAGFKYKAVAKKLRQLGFVEYRHKGGSHQVWYNEISKQKTVLPKHRGDVPEGTMRAILRQGNIDVDEFLEL